MSSDEYELLDSGEGAKLERFGQLVVDRPAPQSLWQRRLPPSRWKAAHGSYLRSSSGGGSWRQPHSLPESWTVQAAGMRFSLRPTGFGHVGMFPEQIPFWRWIQTRCEQGRHAPLELLNLFAYSGGSSLAAASASAKVTHCDASKGVVSWARENAQLNGLGEAPIRWIVDDALKFVQREARRRRHYDAIILDPPSFGRGPKGEVWKLEEQLAPLLSSCAEILSDDASFVLLSAHTPGVGPLALENLLSQSLSGRGGHLRRGEMFLKPAAGGPTLPSGSWSSWTPAEDDQGPELATP